MKSFCSFLPASSPSTGACGLEDGSLAGGKQWRSRLALWRPEPWPEEWLLIEWPENEAARAKYWLSTLPASTPIRKLAGTAKLRWRIEPGAIAHFWLNR